MNIMDELQQYVKSLPDDPSFLQAYGRHLVLARNLSPKSAAMSYFAARELSQYVHYKAKYFSKPASADAHRGMSISQMEVSELAPVDESYAMEYLAFLDTVARNKPDTIRRKISTIRGFYEYLGMQQEELGVSFLENPFRNTQIIVHPKPATVMTKKEICKLMDSIEGANALRDKAMIFLILSSGIRLEELAALDVDDLEENMLTIKGSSPRTLALNQACTAYLETYLREYRGALEGELKDNALFVSKERKKRLSHRRIQQFIEEHMAAAGFEYKDYSATTLRDTAISMILNGSEHSDVSGIMEYLGFRSSQRGYRFTTPKHKAANLMQNLDIPGGSSDG